MCKAVFCCWLQPKHRGMCQSVSQSDEHSVTLFQTGQALDILPWNVVWILMKMTFESSTTIRSTLRPPNLMCRFNEGQALSKNTNEPGVLPHRMLTGQNTNGSETNKLLEAWQDFHMMVRYCENPEKISPWQALWLTFRLLHKMFQLPLALFLLPLFTACFGDKILELYLGADANCEFQVLTRVNGSDVYYDW